MTRFVAGLAAEGRTDVDVGEWPVNVGDDPEVVGIDEGMLLVFAILAEC